MKPVLAAAGLIATVGIHQVFIGPALDRVAAESLSGDARLAIALRCGESDRPAATRCRADLERLFASGALQPDRTLRAYCAEVRSAPWGRQHPSPPRVCVERFGTS